MSAKDQIKQIVDFFKRENYLKDKTNGMAEGLMLGASLADEANERSKNATETTLAVQEKYKEQILAQDLNPNKDPELVDLRNGEQTAGERITKFETKTAKHLSEYTTLTDWKTTDNTWNNALNACFIYLKMKTTDKRGGKILAPSGVYELSPFAMPMRVWIEGEGIGVTVFKLKAGSVGNFITFDKYSLFSRLSHISIDGNKNECPEALHNVFFDRYTQSEHTHTGNMVVDKSFEEPDTYTYNAIESVLSGYSKGDGFHIRETFWGSTFRNLFTYESDGHGIYNTALDVFFDTIQAERSGLNGIYENGNNNRWSNIKTIWNGQKTQIGNAGFKITGKRSIFSNVEAQDNFCDGIRIENGHDLQLPGFIVDGNNRPIGTSTGENFYGIHILGGYNIKADGVATNYSGTQKQAYLVEDGTQVSRDIELNIFEDSQQKESPSLYIPKNIYYSDDYLYNGSVEPTNDSNGLRVTSANNMAYFFDKNALKEEGVLELIVNFNSVGATAKIVSDHVVYPYNQFLIQRTLDGWIQFIMTYTKKDGTTGTGSVAVDLTTFPVNKDIKIIAMWRKRMSNNERGVIYLKVESSGIFYENTAWVESVASFIAPRTCLAVNRSSSAGDRWDGLLKFLQISSEIPQTIYDNYAINKRKLPSTDLFYDFQNYRPKKDVTKIIDFTGQTGFGYLPPATSFYRGKTLVITNPTSGDSIVTCLRNADGSYSWK